MTLIEDIQQQRDPQGALPLGDERDNATLVQASAACATMGHYSGDRLWSSDRDRYMAIAALLSQGMGIGRICRVLEVHPMTVMAVRDREGVPLDVEARRIGSMMRGCGALLIETILDRLNDPKSLEKTSLKDLAIVLGIIDDHQTDGQTVAGRAGRPGDDQGPSHSELQAYLHGLRDMWRMGSGGESREQKTAPAPVGLVVGPAADGDPAADGVELVRGDDAAVEVDPSGIWQREMVRTGIEINLEGGCT